MLQRIIKTEQNNSLLLLRIVLGLVMLGHGLQKAFGWFGGFGWDNTINYFGSVGVPSALGGFIILIESFGAVLLILGLAGRIQAVLMIAVMIGAMVIDHAKNGFFMNWLGNQAGEGIEFDLLFFAMAIVIVINGSGSYSLDRFLGTVGIAKRRHIAV